MLTQNFRHNHRRASRNLYVLSNAVAYAYGLRIYLFDALFFSILLFVFVSTFKSEKCWQCYCLWRAGFSLSFYFWVHFSNQMLAMRTICLLYEYMSRAEAILRQLRCKNLIGRVGTEADSKWNFNCNFFGLMLFLCWSDNRETLLAIALFVAESFFVIQSFLCVH